MKNYNPDVLNCLANLSNEEVFTTPEFANQILDELPKNLFSNPDIKFIDPCLKSGVFLREIAIRLDIGLENQIIDKNMRIQHILKKQIFGIATTELTSLIGRRTLYCSKTANNKYSLLENIDNEKGNVEYDRYEHFWKNNKCIYCGASQKSYDRDQELETYAYPFIHLNDLNSFKNMKFDVIIGNPPYQFNDGGGTGSSAKPIYNKFIEQAKKLNPKHLIMIIPSRWYSGGKGLDEFRNEMLNDNRIKKIVDYPDARDCFPGVDIAGGVCYFHWEKNYFGEAEIITNWRGKVNTSKRKLNEFNIFIRDSKAVEIIRSIKSKNSKAVEEIISSRNPFNLPSKIRPKENGDLILISSASKGKYPSEKVLKGHEYIGKWKVFISKASYDHGGQSNKDGQRRIFSKVIIGKPQEVCTETYLVGGCFDNEKYAINFATYLKTKFVRFLIGAALLTQNITKDKFGFVPLMDLNKEWSDEILYSEFNLGKEEISLIENSILEMV